MVVTKDGEQERTGDILRFTLKWNGQEPGMFDVCKCMERQLQNSFDQVVGALTSNDGTYADDLGRDAVVKPAIAVCPLKK